MVSGKSCLPNSARQQNHCSDKKMSNPCRKVTFHSKIFVRGIPELSTYSSEEIFGQWYGRQELMSMLEETRKVVGIMVSGDVEKMDDGYCERGLEIRSGERAEQRRRLKLEALNGEFPGLLHFLSLNGCTKFSREHAITFQSRFGNPKKEWENW